MMASVNTKFKGTAFKMIDASCRPSITKFHILFDKAHILFGNDPHFPCKDSVLYQRSISSPYSVWNTRLCWNRALWKRSTTDSRRITAKSVITGWSKFWARLAELAGITGRMGWGCVIKANKGRRSQDWWWYQWCCAITGHDRSMVTSLVNPDKTWACRKHCTLIDLLRPDTICCPPHNRKTSICETHWQEWNNALICVLCFIQPLLQCHCSKASSRKDLNIVVSVNITLCVNLMCKKYIL